MRPGPMFGRAHPVLLCGEVSFLMIKQRRVYYVSELSGHVVVQQSDVSCLLVKSFFDVGHDVEVFNRNTNNQPGRLPRQ